VARNFLSLASRTSASFSADDFDCQRAPHSCSPLPSVTYFIFVSSRILLMRSTTFATQRAFPFFSPLRHSIYPKSFFLQFGISLGAQIHPTPCSDPTRCAVAQLFLCECAWSSGFLPLMLSRCHTFCFLVCLLRLLCFILPSLFLLLLFLLRIHTRVCVSTSASDSFFLFISGFVFPAIVFFPPGRRRQYRHYPSCFFPRLLVSLSLFLFFDTLFSSISFC